jgi:hypothetical protein
MAILQETRTLLRDVAQRREKAKSVWLLRCAMAAAGCMEEPVQGHELQRVWRGPAEHVGSTVGTPRRRRPSSFSFVSYSGMLATR